jgi:hypothetical protein
LPIAGSQLNRKESKSTYVKSLTIAQKIKVNYLHLLKYSYVTHLDLKNSKPPSTAELKNTLFKVVRYEK